MGSFPHAPADRRSRSAMRGFKEDFDAWKSSLSPEEAELMRAKAKGEFDKNFRKSEDFKKNLPEEKTESFGKILGKFFDSESEDYQKELESTLPRPPSVLDKVLEKEFEFRLTHRIVTIDRDAERRYKFAMQRNTLLQMQGEEGVGESSPMKELWAIQNDDAESNAGVKNLYNVAKAFAEDKDCPPELSKMMKDVLAKGVPAIGEKITAEVPLYLMNQLMFFNNVVDGVKEKLPANLTADEAKEWKGILQEALANVAVTSTREFYKLQKEIEEDVEGLKAAYRTKLTAPHKTKADVLKAIWTILPQILDKPVPPIDEELLAAFAEMPANDDEEGYMHPWGVASKLYKSVAIDSFGQKYLLGVFETEEECFEAFDSWNDEYKKARAEMQLEMQE